MKIAKTIGENSAYSGKIDQHPSYRVIKDHVSENNIPVFNFKPVNAESVSDIINWLPTGKAPGYDNIAGQCLKAAKSSIVLPLQCLLNRMFVESSFPDPLKHADISPQTGMSWLTGYANHSRHLVHMLLTIVIVEHVIVDCLHDGCIATGCPGTCII